MSKSKFPEIVRLQEELDRLPDLVSQAGAEFDLLKNEDGVAREVMAIKSQLQKIIESVDQWGLPDLGPYRKGGVVAINKPQSGTQTYRFSDLKEELERNAYSISLNKKELADWRNLQVKKLPGWWARLRANPENLNPENGLQSHIELREQAMQKFYGTDYSVDKDKIVYQGDLNSLMYALRHQLVVGVAIEDYHRVEEGEKDLSVEKWLLEKMESDGWKLYDYENMKVGQTKLGERSAYPKISFICKGSLSKNKTAIFRKPKLEELIFAGISADGKKKNFAFMDTSHLVGLAQVHFQSILNTHDPEGMVSTLKNVVSFYKEKDFQPQNFVVV